MFFKNIIYLDDIKKEILLLNFNISMIKCVKKILFSEFQDNQDHLIKHLKQIKIAYLVINTEEERYEYKTFSNEIQDLFIQEKIENKFKQDGVLFGNFQYLKNNKDGKDIVTYYIRKLEKKSFLSLTIDIILNLNIYIKTINSYSNISIAISENLKKNNHININIVNIKEEILISVYINNIIFLNRKIHSLDNNLESLILSNINLFIKYIESSISKISFQFNVNILTNNYDLLQNLKNDSIFESVPLNIKIFDNIKVRASTDYQEDELCLKNLWNFFTFNKNNINSIKNKYFTINKILWIFKYLIILLSLSVSFISTAIFLNYSSEIKKIQLEIDNQEKKYLDLNDKLIKFNSFFNNEKIKNEALSAVLNKKTTNDYQKNFIILEDLFTELETKVQIKKYFFNKKENNILIEFYITNNKDYNSFEIIKSKLNSYLENKKIKEFLLNTKDDKSDSKMIDCVLRISLYD